MRPNLRDVFDAPNEASINMTEREVFTLAKMIARHTTIKNIGNVVAYCDRLMDDNLDAVRVIVNAVLDRSGGFKSPLVRANNSPLVDLLEVYFECSLSALKDLNE